jgi:hypothetical protein
LSEIDITELRDFLELKSLNQISTRVYYLYYRTLTAFKEQRDSLSKYSFDTIMAVIDGVLAIGALLTFLQGVADVYKVTAILVTATVVVVLFIVRERIRPKGELATLTGTLRLAVHLDQILKQASEVMLLGKVLERKSDDRLVKDLATDNCAVLRDSIDSVERLVKDLGSDKKLEEALEDIHIDRSVLDRRIRLGKSTLEKYERLLG